MNACQLWVIGMFVTSARNVAAFDLREPMWNWPGPRIVLKGSGQDEASIQNPEFGKYFIVMDFACAPKSRFDALRMAVLCAKRARIPIEGPFLFSEDTLSGAEVARLLEDADNDPWIVEYASEPVGDSLSLLLLGKKIVQNPLFTTFFANLAEGVAEAHTPALVDALIKHLSWQSVEAEK